MVFRAVVFYGGNSVLHETAMFGDMIANDIAV
jgi:hypothetical protein